MNLTCCTAKRYFKWPCIFYTLLVAVTGGISAPPSLAQPNPGTQPFTAKDLPRVPPTDIRIQTELFGQVRRAPSDMDDAIIVWVEANRTSLQPLFLLEAARRLLPRDPQTAFRLTAQGWIRATYDAYRCKDQSARQVASMALMLVSPVMQAAKTRPTEWADAGLWTLSQPMLFETKADPSWACASGIQAYQGAPYAGKEALIAEDQWPPLKQKLTEDFKKFFEEQKKPTTDPITLAPESLSLSEITGSYLQTNDYYWLNGRSLVVGDSGTASRPATVSIWHIDGTHKEIAMKDVPSASSFRYPRWCAADNRIALYNQTTQIVSDGNKGTSFKVVYLDIGTDDNVLKVYEQETRQFDKVKPNYGGVWSYGIRDPLMSHIDCQVFAAYAGDDPASTANSGKFLPLLRSHGLFRFDQESGRNKNSTIYFHRDRNDPGKKLDIQATQLAGECVKYYEYNDRYFVFDCDWKSKRQQVCLEGWWFSPRDQSTEHICIKNDALAKEGALLFPSQKGWIAVVFDRSTAQGPKSGGIYRVTPNGEAKKILNTFVRSFSPAPNGCLFAFTFSPPDTNDNLPFASYPSRLHMGDLCDSLK